MSYLCLKVLRIVLISVKFTNTLILGQPSWVIFLCSGYPPWLNCVRFNRTQTKIALSSNLVYKLPPKMVGRGRTSTCYKELFYGTRLRVLLSVHTFSRDTNETAENSYRNTVAKVLSPKKVIVTLWCALRTLSVALCGKFSRILRVTKSFGLPLLLYYFHRLLFVDDGFFFLTACMLDGVFEEMINGL